MLTHLVIAAADAENGFILPHKIEEVFWGSLAFVIVVSLMVWKGGPAVKNMWNARIDRIRNELETAETARQGAEAELTQVEASIADADSERERLLREAAETAETVKAQLVARAGTDAADVRARGLADVEATKAQATGDLQSEIGVLALGAAEAVVVNSLDESTQAELIEGYISRVGAQA
jgi:F-type H+-transporting ATPase subunit b